MKPVIALVGRPNVGKSTLFNRLTKTRAAIVADQPGLTRDRNYGAGRLGDKPYIVVDTGGLSGEREDLDQKMAGQVFQAINEAAAVLFVVDGRDGLTAGDRTISKQLRACNKPIFVVVNKSDTVDPEMARVDFQELGFAEVFTISSTHGHGVSAMIDEVLEKFPDADEADAADGAGVKVAIIGRPNVGKSTLVNRLLGEERVVAFDQPGTTRDSIFIPFEHEGKRYTLIDTAGVRRKSRVSAAIEKFSAIKTLQAIEEANVVVLVLDAHEGLSDQDATLSGFVLDSGRALVIAANKWDGLAHDVKERFKSELDRRLPFLDFAETLFISALHGSGVGHLLEAVDVAYEAATKDLSTPQLTRVLEDAITQHQPPLVKGRRIKLRYAHQGGRNPPTIIIHGNQTEDVPDSYRRFLMNIYRKVFKLYGTPLRIEFKGGTNPFAGRKNVLTDRQKAKKRRLKKFIKKKD
jgi:GTP-binding protein